MDHWDWLEVKAEGIGSFVCDRIEHMEVWILPPISRIIAASGSGVNTNAEYCNLVVP